MNDVRRRNIKIPILVGIVVLKNLGMAKYMNGNVPGVVVPEPLMKELADTPKDDMKKKAIEISARLVRAMRAMCQGAHLMTLGWDDTVAPIVEQATLSHFTTTTLRARRASPQRRALTLLPQ